MLLEHPKMGRPGRVEGTRELVVSNTPFIVIYRLQGQHVEVIRLLHSAQLWP
jgi:toxin ParE1/3/4